MNNPFYNIQDLLIAYQSLNIQQGDTLYVTGNLGRLGLIKDKTKSEILDIHLSTLSSLVGNSGTIIVPAHSFSLCNTTIPFNVLTTPSEMGPFTELIRQHPDAVRSMHPFSSCASIGKNSRFICLNTSQHAYGFHSPFHRMVELGAKFVSIGMPAQKNVSLVHHAEFLMGVPYRYSKEFSHPIETEKGEELKNYYLSVTYLNMDITRDKNKKIFEKFIEKHDLHKSNVGLSSIQLFDMNEFIESTTVLLASDIYAWLAHPPKNRPYRD